MKQETIRRILETKKPLRIRYGFGWKGAQWQTITKEKLIQIVENGFYAHYDIADKENYFGISFYSESDMM